jgi:SPP1 gp7 family putative phage head morphogenesis protein
MQNLCDRAADLGISHVETEVGLQPRTFARKEQALFPDVDKIITEYARNRAFWITGIAKEDILMTVRSLITNWSVANKTPYPDDLLVKDIERALSDWLPQGTNIAARAELIARVNVSDVYNYSRFQVLTAQQLSNLVEAFLYSAILDGKTTPLCRSLSGRIFTAEDLRQSGLIPPNHFRCRSILLPVTTYDKGWQEVYQGQSPLTTDQSPQEGFYADSN